MRSLVTLVLLSLVALAAQAFAPTVNSLSVNNPRHGQLFMSGDESIENLGTQDRIKALVEENPVLLFMKGSKLFPQCGFSNTATQILMSFNVDFHTVDVLADENIRQGIKEFSQWPTIPQLYVDGEFIGGSDIMIEMYQSGELGEMVEKAKANQM